LVRKTPQKRGGPGKIKIGTRDNLKFAPKKRGCVLPGAAIWDYVFYDSVCHSPQILSELLHSITATKSL